jgi:hypothetical protein
MLFVNRGCAAWDTLLFHFLSVNIKQNCIILEACLVIFPLLILAIFFQPSKDIAQYLAWMWDTVKIDIRINTSRLDMDIAVIEKSGEESRPFSFNVLDIVQWCLLATFTKTKGFAININDIFVSQLENIVAPILISQ